MSQFYDDMQATALELLAEFGAPVLIERETGEVFDPVTGVTTPGTKEVHGAVGVVTDFSAENVDGQLIKTGDRLVTIAAKGLAITPALSDIIKADSKTYSVINIEEVNPAGTPLVYKIQVRE